MTLGVLDWGMGGLFALQRAMTRQPSLDAVYLSDSGNQPYGLQSRRQLAKSVRLALERLVDEGADHIVVACHSGSSALPDVPSVGVPVVGVIEPRSVTGHDVLVLGGARTIRSGVWRRALARDGRRVRQRIAQPLSAHVEAGRALSVACTQDLERILAPCLSSISVVLACTHYAALHGLIAERMPGAALVDPAMYVVDRLPLAAGQGSLRLFTTGSPQALNQVAERAMGWTLPPVQPAG